MMDKQDYTYSEPCGCTVVLKADSGYDKADMKVDKTCFKHNIAGDSEEYRAFIQRAREALDRVEAFK